MHADLQAMFDMADTDHDGRVNADQLAQLAENLSINIKSKQHAQALVHKYGSSGSIMLIS